MRWTPQTLRDGRGFRPHGGSVLARAGLLPGRCGGGRRHDGGIQYSGFLAAELAQAVLEGAADDDDDPGAAVPAGAARRTLRLARRRDRGWVADRIVQHAVSAASGQAGTRAVLGPQALLDELDTPSGSALSLQMALWGGCQTHQR
ncbi:hypothetical protein ABT072_46430 [Streptomyces sp. NPDC002589]|uniref:hypothetical protein n=1 Tax=Streptomyces sp. NPDC002589 TaxID=3154420 RepID=UPI00332A111F